jgi:hypothetical protein
MYNRGLKYKNYDTEFHAINILRFVQNILDNYLFLLPNKNTKLDLIKMISLTNYKLGFERNMKFYLLEENIYNFKNKNTEQLLEILDKEIDLVFNKITNINNFNN